MHYQNDAVQKFNDTITETHDRLYEKTIFLWHG